MYSKEPIIKLLISMIKSYVEYGDEIGYTKKEMDDIIEKYELLYLDYDYNDAILLYDEKYVTKKEFTDKIRELFDDAQNGHLDIDIVEYIEFLEKNSLVNICIDKMERSDIKKDDDGNWYFYAKGGWDYFCDWFKVDSDYRDNVVKMILNGEGYELFDYNPSDYSDFSYININDDNLKYLKTIVQNMKDDFELDQDEIDNIGDIDDVYSIAKNNDLDDLETALTMVNCRAQGYADEGEAYDYTTNLILEHFNLTLDGLKWVKFNKNSEYDDTLKIKFKDEESAKNAIILLYKIENRTYDDDDFFIEWSSPYGGWIGDADKYIDDEIQERVPDYVDEKYLP